jgi:hypothetical protein
VGETAMMLAARIGAVPVLQLLVGGTGTIDGGIVGNLHARNNNDESALDIAVEGGWEESIAFLKPMVENNGRKCWWILRSHLLKYVQKNTIVSKWQDTVLLTLQESAEASEKKIMHVRMELLETERTYGKELAAVHGARGFPLKCALADSIGSHTPL